MDVKLLLMVMMTVMKRTHLDYYAQALRPILNNLLEKVQRRASCLVHEFRGWSYDHRLNFLR